MKSYSKRLQFILLFFLLFSLEKATAQSYSFYKLENGWYSATVSYSTSSTYTNSTYTLKVKVESDSVTEIDFGNGGSVHDGFNNSGYYYNGGRLNFHNDFDGNLVKATTRITVSEGTNYKYYDVTIE